MSFSDCHVVKCPKMDAGLQAVLQIGICPFHIQELMTLTIDYKSKKHICPFVPCHIQLCHIQLKCHM